MSTLVAQTISNGSVSTSSANVIQGSAKAWVAANGASPYSIRASYNVSSVTNNGAGLYQINFTNAFADTNYAPVIWSSNTGAARRWPQFDGNNNSTAGTIATTNIQFYTGDGSTNTNVVFLWAAFFR